MSDKQNFAKTIIDAWQESIQNLVKDKQFVDLIIDNYAKFQEIVKASSKANENFTSSYSGNAFNPNIELNELRAELIALKQRVSYIEEHSHRGSNPKPKKRKESIKRNK